jgi:hypothetical protein
MSAIAQLRSEIEEQFPSAFRRYERSEYGNIRTGIAAIDQITNGVPLRALTEICGSNLTSSGKTSVLISLLAHASREYFCALVDAGDTFDLESAEAAGVDFNRLYWARCGKNKVKLSRLDQAFAVADIILHIGGFGVIAVDLSSIPEASLSKVDISYWFRLSRLIEKHSAALVFIEESSHATSCAGLVLQLSSGPATFNGNLLTQFNFHADVVRTRQKKPVQSASSEFSLRTSWA